MPNFGRDKTINIRILKKMKLFKKFLSKKNKNKKLDINIKKINDIFE